MWFLVLNALAMTAFIPVRSLGWPIYAVAALNGIANGTARVALFAMVYPLLPRGREGQAMAVQSLSGQGPASFGALLGEFIMRRLGFTVLFATAGTLCLFAAIAVAMVEKDLPHAHHPAAVSARARDGGYLALLLNRSLLPYWIVTFCFGFAMSSRMSFIAPFAYRQGITSIGIYFTLYGVVAVFVRLSGSLMDRLGLDRMLAPVVRRDGRGHRAGRVDRTFRNVRNCGADRRSRAWFRVSGVERDADSRYARGTWQPRLFDLHCRCGI